MRHPAGAGVWLLRAAAVVASALFLIAVHAAFGGSSTALAAEKGLLDPRLAWSVAGSPERKALVRELSGGLGTNWVRLNVYWNKLEPTRGTYDPREVGRLDSLVDDLRAVGVKVILTTCAMPVWAQEQRWWSHPPPGFAKGPQGCYPLRRDALPAYRALGGFLATHFKGRVRYLECWNEPNLWVGICPQRTAADPWFAARRYLHMLRAFSLGVRCARTGALVVAGAGAPNGRNDVLSTSPRDLALFLQRHGAARYFDVYSHHPYTPGGTVRTGPTDTPNDG
jgi:hypothetical protein